VACANRHNDRTNRFRDGRRRANRRVAAPSFGRPMGKAIDSICLPTSTRTAGAFSRCGAGCITCFTWSCRWGLPGWSECGARQRKSRRVPRRCPGCYPSAGSPPAGVTLFALLDLFAMHDIAIPYYTGRIRHTANGAMEDFHGPASPDAPVDCVGRARGSGKPVGRLGKARRAGPPQARIAGR